MTQRLGSVLQHCLNEVYLDMWRRCLSVTAVPRLGLADLGVERAEIAQWCAFSVLLYVLYLAEVRCGRSTPVFKRGVPWSPPSAHLGRWALTEPRSCNACT